MCKRIMIPKNAYSSTIDEHDHDDLMLKEKAHASFTNRPLNFDVRR